jgi:hypothetical protein
MVKTRWAEYLWSLLVGETSDASSLRRKSYTVEENEEDTPVYSFLCLTGRGNFWASSWIPPRVSCNVPCAGARIWGPL